MVLPRNASIRKIQRALLSNPGCETGVVVKTVWHTDRGYWDEPEALCLLSAGDPYWGYWYGHVRAIECGFAAYLVKTPDLASAQTAEGVLSEFFKRMIFPERLDLPRANSPLKVYAEAPWFEMACEHLAGMVAAFSTRAARDICGEPAEERILKLWQPEDSIGPNVVTGMAM